MSSEYLTPWYSQGREEIGDSDVKGDGVCLLSEGDDIEPLKAAGESKRGIKCRDFSPPSDSELRPVVV